MASTLKLFHFLIYMYSSYKREPTKSLWSFFIFVFLDLESGAESSDCPAHIAKDSYHLGPWSRGAGALCPPNIFKI